MGYPITAKMELLYDIRMISSDMTSNSLSGLSAVGKGRIDRGIRRTKGGFTRGYTWYMQESVYPCVTILERKSKLVS